MEEWLTYDRPRLFGPLAGQVWRLDESGHTFAVTKAGWNIGPEGIFDDDVAVVFAESWGIDNTDSDDSDAAPDPWLQFTAGKEVPIMGLRYQDAADDGPGRFHLEAWGEETETIDLGPITRVEPALGGYDPSGEVQFTQLLDDVHPVTLVINRGYEPERWPDIYRGDLNDDSTVVSTHDMGPFRRVLVAAHCKDGAAKIGAAAGTRSKAHIVRLRRTELLVAETGGRVLGTRREMTTTRRKRAGSVRIRGGSNHYSGESVVSQGAARDAEKRQPRFVAGFVSTHSLSRELRWRAVMRRCRSSAAAGRHCLKCTNTRKWSTLGTMSTRSTSPHSGPNTIATSTLVVESGTYGMHSDG